MNRFLDWRPQHQHYCIRLTAFFSRTIWVVRHQKGKPFWILLDQEMMRWQWHQLDHMQIICTSLQTDNHSSTSPLKCFCEIKCIRCRNSLYKAATASNLNNTFLQRTANMLHLPLGRKEGFEMTFKSWERKTDILDVDNVMQNMC